MKALCIDPARVAEFWPYAAPLIRPAMKHGSMSTLADIEADLLARRSLLWIAWDNKNICAALVTQLRTTEEGKVCRLVALGGTGMRKFIVLREEIAAYAKAEGCDLMLIDGREGWMRVLPEFKPVGVILEQRLN